MKLTMEEELALAVLRGDEGAKAAIIDRYLAIRDGSEIEERRAKVIDGIDEGFLIPSDGYAVYHSEPFQNLMDFLGFDWRQNVIGVTIHVYVGRRVEVVARVAGANHPPAGNGVNAEDLTIPSG